MCGIIGYVGKQSAVPELVAGLKKMEYRGYDSWGVAALGEDSLFLQKQVGAIGEGVIKTPSQSFSMGIAHTRWATHGGVTKQNAHPHQSSDQRFLLAQNGIVENYAELKTSLKKQKYSFKTPTDTEVIVHLIHAQLKKEKPLPRAVRQAFLKLKGRNTIILLDRQTDSIVAVRNGSPLVLGHAKDGVILASDTLPLAGKVTRVTYLDDLQMVTVDAQRQVALFDVLSGKKLPLKKHRLDLAQQEVDRTGFEHFMLKEIVEQQHTILEATSYTNQELLPFTKRLKKTRHIYTLGAGTAAFAAGQIAHFLRTIAKLPTQELRSYEIDSYLPLLGKQDVLLVVSQSGETADTLEAVEKAQQRGVKVASLVNMIGSTLSRVSDYAYLSRSGPEICVASTKAYTAQLAWGYLLAMTLVGEHAQAKRQLKKVSQQLQTYFADKKTLTTFKRLAKTLAKKEHFFVIGKDQHYYTALEGALKVKEISYKHFEGFSAGELKHGVIALVEDGTPVFGIVADDRHQSDVLSALAEVKARGAQTIGVAARNHEFFDMQLAVPDGGRLDPILKIIPFQLLSYFLGVELGNDPDKPRNLAKSVTVK